jgi:hypothetical protein
MTIIAEHCIHATLTNTPTCEDHVEVSATEPSSPFFLEVDAMDYCKKWYKAVVVEGSLHGNDDFITVHFVGCMFLLLALNADLFVLQLSKPA